MGQIMLDVLQMSSSLITQKIDQQCEDYTSGKLTSRGSG